MRSFLAILLLAMPAVARGATAPGTASGRFQTDKTTLKIAGAYAFWAKSASPASDDAVIRVAVANDRLDPDFFDKYYDRLRAINNRFVSDEDKVVYFEFAPGGKYHGLSYYFGPGDGCGYCYNGEVASTVRAANNRLQGHLAWKEPGRSFDVDLDVPIPEKEWGKAVPAQGGDPAKIYRAYEAALEARDAAKARAVLDTRMKSHWQKMESEGKLDRYVEYTWKEKHLEMKNPRITGGFVNGDRAVLLVAGEGPYGPVRGEALFRREEGVWRFSEDLLGLE